jgi:DNA-binding MarR family transcriptional regulator
MPDKITLNTQMPLGRHLAILTKMYYGALSRRLEHLEIEKYYSILIFVQGCETKCTQQYIAESLKIDKASMVSIVDYLSEKKFIRRTPNPGDRRAYWIELTPKALKVMPRIHQEINELNKIALKGLSKAEAATFTKALGSISDNLQVLPSDRVIINYKKVKSRGA